METEEPLFYGYDNMALLEWGLSMRDALRSCNADKSALRKVFGSRPLPSDSE